MTRAHIAILLTAALSGCSTLEPAYQRPAAPVPAAFPQGGVYPAGPGAIARSAPFGWEQAFRDLRLQGLIRQALAQNRDLRATVANVAAAHAQFEIQHSQLFPTVDAIGSVAWSRTPVAVAQGGAGSGHVDLRTVSAEVGVSAWEIDLFGRLHSLSKETFEQYLATDEGRRSAQLSLVAEVANAYLTLAADRSQLTISEQTQKSSGESLGLTQSRLAAGVASALDVRQAQTVVEQARADAATRRIAVAQDKNALDLLVGSTVAEDQLPNSLAEIMPSFADFSSGLTSDVLLDRPDVLRAEHILKAANADIGAARAAFFPSISLTGSAGAISPNLSKLFNGGSSAWNFGPTISMPIFTAGRNAAGLRLSQAERDAATANYENAIQSAFRDVANALAQRSGSVEQLAAQKALVDASQDALRLSTARYERGADAYLSTLEAQRTFYGIQQALVSAQLAETSNLVAIFRAVGGLEPRE